MHQSLQKQPARRRDKYADSVLHDLVDSAPARREARTAAPRARKSAWFEEPPPEARAPRPLASR